MKYTTLYNIVTFLLINVFGISKGGECIIEQVFGRTGTSSDNGGNQAVGCTTSNVGNYEVHILSVDKPSGGYRGFQQLPSTVGEIKVDIRHVDGSNRRPIRLVLTSYEAVKWMIDATGEVQITSVFLSSYYASHCSVFVNGIESTAPILILSDTYYSGSQEYGRVGLFDKVKEMYGMMTSYTYIHRTEWFDLIVGVIDANVLPDTWLFLDKPAFLFMKDEQMCRFDFHDITSATNSEPYCIFNDLGTRLAIDVRQNYTFVVQRYNAIVEINLLTSAVVRPTTDLSGISGISFDWMGGNLFWADPSSNLIGVYNQHTKSSRPLIALPISQQPKCVVVDVSSGRIFWGSSRPSIAWTIIGDADYKNFITTNIEDPRALAIDTISQRLFWSDKALGTISSVDISSDTPSDRRTIVHVNQVAFGLAISEDYIFWTSIDGVHVARKEDGQLEKYLPLTGNVEDDAVFNGFYSQPIIPNGCETNNGGCNHICAPAPESKRVCLCKSEYFLDIDGQTCVSNGNCILEPVYGRTSSSRGYEAVGCNIGHVNDHEVHILSVYEPIGGVRGFQQSPYVVGEIEVDIAHVEDSDWRPIRLVLISYEAVKWKIYTQADVELTSVLLLSYYDTYSAVFINDNPLTTQKLTVRDEYYSGSREYDRKTLFHNVRDMYGAVTSYTYVYNTEWFKVDIGVINGLVVTRADTRFTPTPVDKWFTPTPVDKWFTPTPVTQTDSDGKCILEPVYGRTSSSGGYETVGCNIGHVNDYEVHILSVYEPIEGVRGFQQSPSVVGEIEVDIARVENSDWRPIRLVLMSYEAVKWKIYLFADVEITSVLLLSYYDTYSAVYIDDNPLATQKLTVRDEYYSGSQESARKTLFRKIRDIYGVVTSYTYVYNTEWFKLDVGVINGLVVTPTDRWITPVLHSDDDRWITPVLHSDDESSSSILLVAVLIPVVAVIIVVIIVVAVVCVFKRKPGHRRRPAVVPRAPQYQSPSYVEFATQNQTPIASGIAVIPPIIGGQQSARNIDDSPVYNYNTPAPVHNSPPPAYDQLTYESSPNWPPSATNLHENTHLSILGDAFSGDTTEPKDAPPKYEEIMAM